MDTIRIGVAGHTNVGKTTIISTLTRSNAGPIGDKANVTKQNKDVEYKLKDKNDEYESLFATFVDLPGFQNMGVIEYLLKEHKDLEVVENKLTNDEQYSLDLEAIRGIKKCHVVIYVTSLMDVPEQVHEDEINLVKQFQPNVICILNQYINAYKALAKHGVDDRRDQWEQVFKKLQSDYISIDAHWDSPKKVDNLYKEIEKKLYGKEREQFVKGLKKFKAVRNSIRRGACLSLFEAIQPISNTYFQTVSFKQREYDHSGYQEKNQAELKTVTNNMLASFSEKVSDIYSIASASPTASFDDIKYQVDRKINYAKKDEFAKNQRRTAGYVGAFIGSVSGLIIELVTLGTTGGAGVVTGARIGQQVFSKLAENSTISSAIGEYDGAEDTIYLAIDKKIISSIVILSLATIWGISQVGYATQVEDESRSKRKLSGKEIVYLAGLIEDNNSFCFDSLNWQSPNDNQKDQIIHYFENLLDFLEDKEDIYDPEFVMTLLKVNPVQSLKWKKAENTSDNSKKEPKALRDTREALRRLKEEGKDI